MLDTLLAHNLLHREGQNIKINTSIEEADSNPPE